MKSGGILIIHSVQLCVFIITFIFLPQGTKQFYITFHCLHPVVYHDWWYLAVNTTIKINH
jgi:hypothetical protein